MTSVDKADIRHEGMRIGGEIVFTDDVIEVKYPYTDEVIGTVPAGKAEHAAKAFEIAANYKSKLSRYERSQILQRAGELIGERPVVPVTLLGERLVLFRDNDGELGLQEGVVGNGCARVTSLVL